MRPRVESVARLPLAPGRNWLMPLGLAIVGVGLVAYAMSDERGQVLLAALAGCAVCVLSYLGVNMLLPQYYALRLLIVSYTLQLLALACIAGLGLPLGPQYHPFQIDAGDAPIRAVLAMVTAPIGALAAALIWCFFRRLLHRPETRIYSGDIAGRRRIYLIAAAMAHLLYWPAGLENAGIIGYVGRILASMLVVAPFLAGRDSWNDRRLGILWSVTILINAAIGIAAGTRSKALIAAVLFCAGYISALPKRKRVVVSGCALVLAIPLIQLSGALGVVRDELGRGGLEMVESGRVTEVFQQLSREMTARDGQGTEAVWEHGVSRLLAWTNVVVPMMTPTVIPYRGMDGFIDEAMSTFRVASVSGLTPDDLYDAGLWNAPARQYGFAVNAFTSVEFTLAADGWSRGGFSVALTFAFVAGLVLMLSEVGAYRLHRFGPGVASIIALPVARAAFFDTSFVPLLPMLRSLILYLGFVMLIVLAIEFSRHAVRSSRPRKGAAAPVRWRPLRG